MTIAYARWVSVHTGSTEMVGVCFISQASLPCTQLYALDRCGLTLADYVEGLHEAVVRVLDDFDLQGAVIADLPGVFLGRCAWHRSEWPSTAGLRTMD